jgi:hypothetical protein
VSILNPLPAISSVKVLSSDDRGLIVDIAGTGFLSQSLASVDGTEASTEFLSGSELHASAQTTTSGLTVAVEVSNPDPGAATSNEIDVTLPPSTLGHVTGCTSPYANPSPGGSYGVYNAL